MDAEEYNRRGIIQFNSNVFDLFMGVAKPMNHF